MNLCNLDLHHFVGLTPSRRYLERKCERIMSLLGRKQDRLVTVHEQFNPLGQTKGSFIAFELNEMKIKGRKFIPERQKYTKGN